MILKSIDIFNEKLCIELNVNENYSSMLMKDSFSFLVHYN